MASLPNLGKNQVPGRDDNYYVILTYKSKRHSGRVNILTASIDRMTFLKPVFLGNALILTARLNYVRKSSMEVEVTVLSEDLGTVQGFMQVLLLLQWLLWINMENL
jgi:hypothetical protein